MTNPIQSISSIDYKVNFEYCHRVSFHPFKIRFLGCRSVFTIVGEIFNPFDNASMYLALTQKGKFIVFEHDTSFDKEVDLISVDRSVDLSDADLPF